MKASKIQLLEYIYRREVVTRLDLMQRFGYTSGGISSMLNWLKKEGLIINDRRGEWVITDRGMARLTYYGRL